MSKTRKQRRRRQTIRRRRAFFEQLQDRTLLASVAGVSAGADSLEIKFDDTVAEQAVADVGNWRVQTADGTAVTLKNLRYDAGAKILSMDIPGLAAGPHKVFADTKDIGLETSDEIVVTQQGGGTNNKFVVVQPQGDRFAVTSAAETGMSPGAVAMGDVTGDGTPTVAVAGLVDEKVNVFTRLNNGPFVTPTGTNIHGPIQDVEVAHVNGDNKGDLVAVSLGKLSVGIGDGNRKFTVTEYVLPDRGKDVEIADVDEDGDADVGVSVENVGIILYKNDGSGKFQTQTTINVSAGAGLAAADVDQDGHIDFVTSGPATHDITIVYGPTFTKKVVVPVPGNSPKEVAVLDANRDGKFDIAFIDSSTNEVGLVKATGSRSFELASKHTTYQTPTDIAAFDGRLLVTTTVEDQRPPITLYDADSAGKLALVDQISTGLPAPANGLAVADIEPFDYVGAFEAPTVHVGLEVRDSSGKAVSKIAVGPQYDLAITVKDARPVAGAKGVYSAYVGFQFDATTLGVTGKVNAGASFPNGVVAESSTPGKYTVLGAFGTATAPERGPYDLVTMPVEAIKDGTLELSLGPVENRLYPTLLHGSDIAVDDGTEIAFSQLVLPVYHPVDAVDETAATDEDTAKPIDVVSNDVSKDGRTLTISAFDAASKLGATVTKVDGRLRYDPSGASQLQAMQVGQKLTDTFTYTVTDGDGGSDTATVAVTVAGVNDAPIVEGYQTSTVAPAAVQIKLRDLAADVDDPLTSASIIVVSAPAHGQLTVDGNHVGTYVAEDGFFGQDTFSFRVKDVHGAMSEPAIVTIHVLSPHQNPNNRLDVNADGVVSPLDVLVVVVRINAEGSGILPVVNYVVPPYIDPSGDGLLSPLDALLPINYLNRRAGGGQGEGESPSAMAYSGAAGAVDAAWAASPDVTTAIIVAPNSEVAAQRATDARRGPSEAKDWQRNVDTVVGQINGPTVRGDTEPATSMDYRAATDEILADADMLMLLDGVVAPLF